jgi:RNA polymerase sigma-70 factor (ECF subfamily)
VAPRTPTLKRNLVEREHQRAKATRWSVSETRFEAALETSVAKAFSDQDPSAREVERYLSTLHVEDLALACACADGNDAAWDHFVAMHRPVLYRSADALEPGGGARDIADALYADLFGLQERDGERQSLFRYFHGRSSLATWLRAILAQRLVDRARTQRRLEPLPEGDVVSPRFSSRTVDPDRVRHLGLICAALAAALGRLPDRDRLRLSLYYKQQLTMAQAGLILKEHEATISRQLARSRTALRKDVEQHLRQEGLSEAEIARCFECVIEDAGPLDLGVLLDKVEPCKEGAEDRSI